MTGATPPPVEVDLLVEAGDWAGEEALGALVERALAASFAVAPLDAVEDSELSVVFTDDAHIQALNGTWRQKDKATNVLSFPGTPPGAVRFGPMLGDIVIAEETVRSEAAADGIAFDDHLTHLLVHGLLHLFGHDHMEDEEAEHMEALETAILGRLGIADPYADRAP